MGEVYRARDSKLGREVAIKVLPDVLGQDGERLSRFKREAKVLASLNHPNIASTYGLECSENIHYLVLELVDGETLQERISRGRVSVEEATQIATKIAEALEEAHEHGIVHRDLKPANINKNPEKKRWEIPTQGLTGAYIAISNAMKQAVGQEKFEQFNGGLWFEAGKGAKEFGG